MRVAHLEKSTGFGSSLLYGGFDELVDKSGDYEAESEEHALVLRQKMKWEMKHKLFFFFLF